MAQRQKRFVFSEYNLGINGDFQDYKTNGLADKIINLECKNGSIKSANRFDDLFALIEPTRADSAKQVFLEKIGGCNWVASYEFFSDENLVTYIVFCSLENKIFYYQLGLTNPEFKSLDNVTFTSVPKYDFFIKDKQNIMLLCSDTDNMWVWDGINEPYQVLDAPVVSSMAIGLDRLFVVCDSCPYSVLFSDDLDPSNWSITAGEAGEVVFNDNLGKVLNVFALDNYIYVMRDKGIVKLYGYKQSENSFNISRVYASSSKIYKNSIAVAGDKIIFMCSDGIYSFDGLNGKKIYNNLNGLIYNPQLAFARCVDNTYYLCANLYENLDFANALICIDLESKNITNICCGYVYKNLCKLDLQNDSQLVVLSADIVSKNANSPMNICKNIYQNVQNADYLYSSHFINVEPKSENKVLTTLTFLCKTDATICVVTDTQTKQINIKKSNYFQSIKLNLKAKIFAIKIYGKGHLDLSHITLDYCFVE